MNESDLNASMHPLVDADGRITETGAAFVQRAGEVMDGLVAKAAAVGWTGCLDSGPDSTWSCIEFDGTGLWCVACLQRAAVAT